MLGFGGAFHSLNQRQRFVLPCPETNSKFTTEHGWLEYEDVSSWDGLFLGAMLVWGSVFSIKDSSSFSLKRISMNLFTSLVPKHSFLFRKFRSPNEAHCLWFVLVWYLEKHKSSCWIIWTVWRNTLSLTYFLSPNFYIFFTGYTPGKLTANATEKSWLEEDFPFGMVPFQMRTGRLQGVHPIISFSDWTNCSSHKRRKSRATWITASQPKQKYDNISKKSTKKRTKWAICLYGKIIINMLFANFLSNILNKHVETSNDQIP